MNATACGAAIYDEPKWKFTSLKEVADIGAGNSAPQKKEFFEGGKYPFIRTSDVGQIRFGAIDGAHDLLNDDGISGLRLVPAGTILMPKSGASTFLNHRVVMSGDGYVSSHLATITARQNLAEPRYLFYYLSTVRAQDLIQDHKYPSLTLAIIGDIPVPLPPLDKQKRIVAVLDQTFAAIDRARVHAEANLADAQELFDNTLLAVFDELLPTATMMTLGEAALDFSRGKSRHRPRNDPALYDGNYPFIQTGDIRRSEGSIREHTQTYNDAGLAQSKLWPVGTVCITIAANIAETGVLEFEACFPDSVIGMVPDPAIADAYYAEYMLRYFAKELKLQGKGSAQDNINLATFENAKFPFPTLEQQVRVVDKLDAMAEAVGSLRTRYQQKLADLATLRQSLLQKAFAGELA
ncbi:MAG: restriction endonuclease subunit S [Rhodanobacter sp.]